MLRLSDDVATTEVFFMERHKVTVAPDPRFLVRAIDEKLGPVRHGGAQRRHSTAAGLPLGALC